jgi:quercetin dioxygenase-like cupin family protein
MGKWIWALLVGVLGLGVYAGNVLAMPQPAVSTTQLAKVLFDEIDVNAHTIPADRWQARLKTQGQTDAYVVDNKIAVNGTTGWHSHPGPSLVMVVAGSVTNYSSDQPGCAGQAYSAGQGFIDEGGDHVHMLRNEGSVTAETIAVQLLPKDAVRKMDKPAPDDCQP